MTSDSASLATAWPSAVSPLPKLWVGFLIAFCFFAGLMYAGVTEDEELVLFVRVIASLAAWGEWLFCVHRYHTILQQISPRLISGTSSYPISPGEAVGRHFIPFYNLYWAFKWPTVLSKHLNEAGIKTTSGTFIGLLLFLSFLVVRLDGSVGFALLFACLLSFSGPIRRAVLQYAQDAEAARTFS